jgi:uncharacterized protein with GYD domain
MKNVKYLLTLYFLISLSTPALAGDEDPKRYFMFVSEPDTKGWEMLSNHPADRRKQVEKAFEALGGEILSYYFGLGDGKTYITVTLPDDNVLIQAVYLMRMPTGLLKSYSVVELMPSDQMADALRKSNELKLLEQRIAAESE